MIWILKKPRGIGKTKGVFAWGKTKGARKEGQAILSPLQVNPSPSIVNEWGRSDLRNPRLDPKLLKAAPRPPV